MTENFTFDAPQFFDFSKVDSFENESDNLEAYFEVDHESLRDSKTKISLENGRQNSDYYVVSDNETECREEVVVESNERVSIAQESSTVIEYKEQDYAIQDSPSPQRVTISEVDYESPRDSNMEASFSECREEIVVTGCEKQIYTTEECSPEIHLVPYEEEAVVIQDSPSPQRATSPEDAYPQPSFGLRRSLSAGNILPMGYRNTASAGETLSDRMEKLHLSPVRERSSSNSKPRGSRLADNINRLAQPKKKFTSTEDLRSQKYVSMAELVNKFQNGTPIRFRTKPKNSAVQRPHTTIPQSPTLNTRTRIRPLHVVSREEKEKKEIEEARKYKIRANPINKRVMQGPVKPRADVIKKPPTVPEPFKITTYPKKEAVPPENTGNNQYHFHAKPVPKSVLEPPKPVEKPHHHTEPKTPEFMKRYSKITPKKEDPKKRNSVQKTKLAYTKPEPFSFEKRDKEMMRKREEYVKKVMEEEKKAREFHAKPVPKSVYRSGQNHSSQDSNAGSTRQGSFTNSVKSCNSDDDNTSVTHFKAKPAKVLYTKPFQPKKEDRPLTEIVPFELSTERRAKEREDFEQKVKEKEELITMLKQREEERRRREEEAEIARLRKEAEYKANPVKKYKEIKIVPSNKVTEPISPNLHTKNIRNKENIADN